MADVLGIVVGLGFVGGGLNLLYSLVVQNLRDLLQYKIRAIATTQGGEKIYLPGAVGTGFSTFSPLTKTLCVRWRIIVTETHGSGKSSSTRKLIDQSLNQAFPVMDKGSTIDVLPRPRNQARHVKLGTKNFTFSLENQSLAELLSLGKPHYYVTQNVFQKLEDHRAIAFLEEHNIKQRGALGNRLNIAIKEYIWQTGDPIFILGKVVRRDRQKKILIPWLISTKPRSQIVAMLAGLGLLGVFLLMLGLKIIYEMLRV